MTQRQWIGPRHKEEELVVKIKPENLKPNKVEKNFRILIHWLDWMAKKEKQGKPGLPDTLKSFLEMAQVEKEHRYDAIKNNFGLLRLKAWRKLVFATEGSKGAYYFLKLVRENTDDDGTWKIRKWTKQETDYDEDSSEVEQEADPASEETHDSTGDGTSPQKGDTIPD